VARLIQELDNPGITVGVLASELSHDQALTAEVLRLANAAALGYGPKSSTISEAVMRLGFRRIKTLVLGASTSSLLMRRLSGYGLTGEELWEHSVACAQMARFVADTVNYPDSEEAYVAGLLHDVGKLVLDQYVRVDYQAILNLMKRRGLQLWQAEEQLIGMDHGAVGGLLANDWHFPLPLVEAIRCHHWPSFARLQPELAAIVNVANVLTPGKTKGGVALGGGTIHPEALRILKLDESRLKRSTGMLVERTALAR
jgi:putative nucleotidyltransferase with HDIG domain